MSDQVSFCSLTLRVCRKWIERKPHLRGFREGLLRLAVVLAPRGLELAGLGRSLSGKGRSNLRIRGTTRLCNELGALRLLDLALLGCKSGGCLVKSGFEERQRQGANPQKDQDEA